MFNLQPEWSHYGFDGQSAGFFVDPGAGECLQSLHNHRIPEQKFRTVFFIGLIALGSYMMLHQFGWI
jgi:hypothetical protein